MEDLSKQKPMSIRLGAIQCRRYCRHCTLTALMAILLVLNGCYGDQIERDSDEIDTGTSQVQFKKHHQRQTLNFNLTLHDSRLLRDETIKSDEAAAGAAVARVPPIGAAHVLMNKSDGRVERNGQTTASVVKTTATNNRFDPKRDQHHKVYQSRNGSPFTLDHHRIIHKFKNTSDARINRDRIPSYRPFERVPNSKPKITSKLFDRPSSSSFSYPTTYLSYNLVRDNVQKTERFMPTSYQHRSKPTTQIKQTSTNYIYKTYYRPIQRNNCNKCRIIPGAPIRHKSYSPTRARYHGTYTHTRLSTDEMIDVLTQKFII